MNIQKQRELVNRLYKDVLADNLEITELSKGYDRKGFYMKMTLTDYINHHEFKLEWREKEELAKITVDNKTYKAPVEINDMMYNFIECALPEDSF